jgi:hypothetical protein
VQGLNIILAVQVLEYAVSERQDQQHFEGVFPSKAQWKQTQGNNLLSVRVRLGALQVFPSDIGSDRNASRGRERI